MALRTFLCLACGTVADRERTYAPVTDRAPYYAGEDRPVPVVCGAVLPDGTTCPAEMDQVLKGIAKDLFSESFIINDVDGKGSRRLSSLQELRAVERESEARHRNGEGQILNFRDFSQDRGNSRTNAFRGSTYETGRSQAPPRRVTGRGGSLPIQVRPTGPRE